MISIRFRGGVKLEFIRNSCNSIWKFAIWLIRKGKKYWKNSMNINSKFVRFDSNYRVESHFSDARFVRNSIWLIQKVKNNSKNSIKIDSKFIRFDLTPPLIQLHFHYSFIIEVILTVWVGVEMKFCLIHSKMLQIT